MIGNFDAVQLLHNTFPELKGDDVAILGQTAVLQQYPAGINICRQGEEGTTLFILVSGEVDVLVHAEEHDIHIDTLGPGSYFGEMAFLGETSRMATILTRTPCCLLVIDYKDFMPIAQVNPTLLRTLLRQIIGHLRRNDRAVIQELNNKNATLRKTYAELKEQEEMRTQFIATISHELRTPLTTIKGFLSLMNQGAIHGDSLKVAMDSITRNVDRMVGLTNDLLILHELHPVAPEYSCVNLADVLIEALNHVREVMNGQTTAVHFDLAPHMPQVYADKRALVLAARALLENAIKFNPLQNPVQVKVSCTPQQDITMAITDRGIGIPAEDQIRIFEPFVRLEREGSSHLFPGLGVGLTIARFVVARHNGRILVDSTPGKGSTFTILLPQSSVPLSETRLSPN